MKAGEKKTVEVPAKLAYGEKFVTSQFVKAAFGKDFEGLEEGREYEISPEMKVKIIEIDGDTVTVGQPNPHPLAGENIVYDLSLDEILPPNGT